MTRTDINFASGETFCAAWLYRPDEAPETALSSHTVTTESSTSGKPRPIIVMAHGLAGTKEERLDAFAERFTAAGYLCLVFDYRHFGASGGEPRQLLVTKLQRQDWKAAVAFARTIDGADPNKVVVWGTSYSGGHVIAIAAEDHRIAAMVSQCPFTDGIASGTTIPPLTTFKVSARALADVLGAALGRKPIMVASDGLPGETALMVSPDAHSGVQGLAPAGSNINKDIAARFALDITRQFPGRGAKKVTCPAFFALCARDTVAPAPRSLHYAQQAPQGEIKLYDAGHFDIYVGADFEENVTDQIDFLRRNVPVQLPKDSHA